MTRSMVKGVHHFTINPRDLASSLRFYGTFLGLERLPDVEMDDHKLYYFALPGGGQLELIAYDRPGPAADDCPTSPGRFRHLALEVADVEEVARSLEQYGGRVLQPPRWVERLGFTGMLAQDPNGCELEFVELPGAKLNQKGEMDVTKSRELALRAAQIRRCALQAIEAAGSGHIGGSFSMAEILAALYFYKLNIDPENPRWEDRDRFVLSKGHCTPTTYAALAMRGFFPLDDLKTFRKIDSYLSGHIEMKHVPGVDMSAGSLGQGVSVAAGMALSGKTYGKGYRVYAVTGDGELQEGQIWEAAMAAAHYRLDNLRVIVDNNGLQLDGPVDEIMSLGSISDKFRAFGWEVFEVQGHDPGQVADALDAADLVTGRPVLILAHTVKGKGVSFFENNVKWHGGLPSPEEFRRAYEELDAAIAELEVGGNG